MVERLNYQGGQIREIAGTKETDNMGPYVVSGDIGSLMQKWAESRGFRLPSSNVVAEIRAEFKTVMSRIFPEFEFIPEEELATGLTSLVERAGSFPISLDGVYYRSQSGIDIARLVDQEGQNRGLGRRGDAPPLLEQFRRIKSAGVKEAVLVDDVIFSGTLINRVSRLLSMIGVRVPVICAGVAIKEGVDKLRSSGIEVRAVRTYEDVTDEVCERDFFPGVPRGGMSLNGQRNVGAPYILPFGNPGKWASIPKEWQESFSRFCIERSIRLFGAIEEASGRPVSCADLDRKVVGLPRDETRVIEVLRQILD